MTKTVGEKEDNCRTVRSGPWGRAGNRTSKATAIFLFNHTAHYWPTHIYHPGQTVHAIPLTPTSWLVLRSSQKCFLNLSHSSRPGLHLTSSWKPSRNAPIRDLALPEELQHFSSTHHLWCLVPALSLLPSSESLLCATRTCMLKACNKRVWHSKSQTNTCFLTLQDFNPAYISALLLKWVQSSHFDL